ncbi:hypothetical protein GQ53DRAFT_713976 [Thozetella sp. PMI_491]|nr:hypothetical protein GQ53DRAFT_713976 [Thozetella sp. PMI_491]
MGRVPTLRGLTSSLAWALLARQGEAAKDVDGNPILVVNGTTPVDVPSTYYSDLHPCPAACGDLKSNNWTVYTSVDRLATCGEPMLLDFAIHNPLDDPNTITSLKVCTSGNATTTTNALFAAAKAPDSSSSSKRDALVPTPKRDAPVCASGASEAQTKLSFGRSGASTAKNDEILETLDHLSAFFEDEHHCDTTVLFGYTDGAVAGIYIGSSFGKSTISSAIKELSEQVKSDGPSETMTAQLCAKGRNSNHVFGIAVDTTGNLAAVQKSVASWSKAECADTYLNVVDNSTFSNGTMSRRSHPRQMNKLQARGDCTTVKVNSGDSCGSLAAACGISGADFTKYNSGDNFCSTLVPGQRVCCSAGTLPDIKPKPNADGSCFSYTVQSGDTCSGLAAEYGLTLKAIEVFNNGTDGTWAWNGCNNLMADMNICLSMGDPPMPAPISNALCGPTMPGSEPPTDGTKLADMNPCPLNACCNIWGQCGISGEFCVEKRGPSDNPGTAPIGVNGCVSNCGMDIKKSDDAPAAYNRIGYYETWNFNRECLNMRVEHANTDGSYTHIHWAFVPIDTATWAPKLDDPAKQWDDFKALDGVKKIVSFGGWGYSTEPATYDIIREAMSPANRATFANNIVKFLNDEGVDGVDFDWEYPGAPDIPGVPPGLETDGPNYLKFLITLRGKLPAGKTMSIAAPASYWYLKQFPIEEMAKQLDYIVYMTYDLHGQWDAANTYSMDGCPGGNCLRSHVNLTETMQVLAMITKANVPSNKIFVGESSYGRSFGMTTAGCTGPMCTFQGDRETSYAAPGMCTETSGYIANAEINEIIQTYPNVKSFHDGESNSDILVYDDYNWVAYMTPTTKSTRRDLWTRYNFAGTIDWAVDLQEFGDEGFDPDNQDDEDVDWYWDWPNPPSTSGCGTTSAATLEDLAADSGVSDNCRAVYTIQLLQKNFTTSMGHYNDLIKNGYDKKFNTYAGAVVDGAPKDVTDFMHNNGNKYFSCVVTEWQLCCAKCSSLGNGLPGSCDYCFKDGDCTSSSLRRRGIDGYEIFGIGAPPVLEIDGPASSGTDLEVRDRPPPGSLDSPIIKYLNVTEPCPPDYSKRGLGQGDPDGDTLYWTLVPDKHDQFFADLFTAVGIEEDNIAFKDIHTMECAPADTTEECHATHWNFGFPQPNGYGKDDVANPKDTVVNAENSVKNLPSQLDDVLSQLSSNTLYGDPDDIIDAIALPIFMIADAIENMDQVVAVADEIDRQKRMAIIFAFLAAIFFFIPIAGEIAGSVAALAGIARIASLIGELGSVAMDIYDVVNNPNNAPLFIFGLLGSVGGLRDVAGVASAAKARRAMASGDVAKLGTKLKGRLDLIDSIKGGCIRKRELIVTEPFWPMTGLDGRAIPGRLE